MPDQAEMALRYPNLVEMAPHLSLCEFEPAFAFGIEALIQLVQLRQFENAGVGWG